MSAASEGLQDRKTPCLFSVASTHATVSREKASDLDSFREPSRTTREMYFCMAASPPALIRQIQTAKSTHHPHKIVDQDRGCKTGGGACFALFSGSDNSHTNPHKKSHLMRKVFCGVGAWLAAPHLTQPEPCFSKKFLYLMSPQDDT